MQKFEHIPAMAPWTAALIGLLKTETAETIDVTKLNEVANGDVAPKGKRYASLNTAIKHVERYYQVVWRWDRTGVRKLIDGEKSEDTKSRTRRIHRAAVRNTRILGTIDLTKLPSDKRQEVVGQATLAAIVSMSTKPSSTKQIEAVKPESVDLRKMLESLR